MINPGIKIPWQVFACAGVLLSLWGFGAWQYHRGANKVQAEWDASVERGKGIVAGMTTKQDGVTKAVEIVYVDRIKVVKEKGDGIAKQVNSFVGSDSCRLSGGFRLLYDAAATNTIPDSSEIPYAESVQAQTVATGVAENFSTCQQAISELEGLREWVNQQRQVYLDQCKAEPSLCKAGK